MIEVVHIFKHEIDPYAETIEKDFFIGRGSILGNPYTSKDLEKTKAKFQCSSKEEALDNYQSYLLNKIEEKDEQILNILEEIEEISNKGTAYLVCYCKPKKCHGDIIKNIIENRIESKKTKTLF